MPGPPDVRALRPGGACRRSTRGRGGSPRWAEPPPPSRCRGHLLPNLPISLANPASGSIAPGRAAQLPTHREAHAPTLGRSPEATKLPARAGCHAGRPPGILPLAGGARLEAAPTPPEPSPPWLRLDGEALASLCAPPLQDLSPALRLHPRAKSVRLLAPAHIGLERPLHQRNSPLGGRTHVVYGPPLTKSRYVRALRPHSTAMVGSPPARRRGARC